MDSFGTLRLSLNFQQYKKSCCSWTERRYRLHFSQLSLRNIKPMPAIPELDYIWLVSSFANMASAYTDSSDSPPPQFRRESLITFSTDSLGPYPTPQRPILASLLQTHLKILPPQFRHSSQIPTVTNNLN